MAKMQEKQKLVVIETNGTLPELGGISGPILNPCLLKESVLIRMVGNHRKVYEVNPKNSSDRIRLTLKNVRTENFKTTQTEVKPQAKVAPKVITEEKRVVEKQVVKEKIEEKKENDFTKK